MTDTKKTNENLIEEFLREGLKGKSETTLKTYNQSLNLFATWLDGSGADLNIYARTDVQQYIDYRVAKKCAASTINKDWSAIRKFSSWLGKDEAIEDIRVIEMPNILNQAPKALYRIERNRLLRDADRYASKRDFAIIVTLLNTGMRVSELCNLDREDLTFSERKGYIRIRGKRNKERDVPANPEVRRAIEKYLEERNDQHASVFISNYNKRISSRTVQRILQKFGHHPHELRHTFTTELVRAGEDWSVIQKLTGHESFQMIQRYSAPTEEDLEDAVNNIYTST